ncbi:hypothetical protein FEM33_01645 [Dyadobacter flavalbus]|uniref:Major capsid protein E n=1 Tax=Dyadobacter flavalbus TaxID=2579942 RepID=A0A5M8R392_9BACT|nr:major capsid protein [Dyadobacter flavalbus]KAA6441464.1 hypothetical protein FEM33_01645 [Dyadobacter flavalbus]
MEQSYFKDWIAKYFPGLVTQVVESINGTLNTPSPYFHIRMLTKEFSVTGKWESINANYTNVMADVVALDSPLPLKKRDSIGGASGKIPKMGGKLQLNEEQLTDLDTTIAVGGTKAQIFAKIFEDTPRAIKLVPERCEQIFLEGLSTGLAIIDDSENVGVGIRVDYKYPTGNKFGVATLWSNASSATPIDDIERVLAKASADGNRPVTVMMDKTALNNLLKTAQIKEQYAWTQSFVGDRIPNLSEDQLKTLFQSKFRLNIEIVDVVLRFEKDGVRSTVRPWADGAVVFISDPTVGSLMWSKVAEMNHPVAGVAYQIADESTLVSKYRKNDPVGEFTSAQARILPVIGNVNSIYLLDSKTQQV